MMSLTLDIEVDGSRLFVSALSPCGHSGVNIPISADVDNPDVIKAIKLLQVAYPYLIAAEIVCRYERGYYPDEQEEASVLANAHKVLSAPDYVFNAYPYLIEMARNISEGRWPTKQRTSQPQPKPGFVYLMRSVDGYFKIGRTGNPEQRMKTMLRLPVPVQYECLIQTKNMNTLEAELLKRFSDKRINGEWFALDVADVEYIKGLA